MVKIIRPQEGRNNVWETDPIKELSSVGIKGLELTYWEDSEFRDKDPYSPSLKQLKENIGTLVCARGYPGSYPLYSLHLKEGGLRTSNCYKLNEGGVIQGWKINLFVVSGDNGVRARYSTDEMPIIYSLLELFELSEPRGIPSARIWVESGNMPVNHDENGFYLCGVGTKSSPEETSRLTIEDFVGRDAFLRSLKKDKRIRFMPDPANLDRWYDPDEEMSLNGHYGGDITVCCRMDKFPLVDGWNETKQEQDSFMWAFKTLCKIQERYNDILTRQQEVARKAF